MIARKCMFVFTTSAGLVYAVWAFWSQVDPHPPVIPRGVSFTAAITAASIFFYLALCIHERMTQIHRRDDWR